MLSGELDEFAVFAEADFPREVLEHENRKVDVLGISLSSKWFLACEFKQINDKNSGGKLGDKLKGLLLDIERLETFWLRKDFPRGQYDEEVYRVGSNCESGYGLVGGLYFVEANENPAMLRFWQDHTLDTKTLFPRGKIAETLDKIVEKLSRSDADWVEPLLVHTFPPTQNKYYLLCAFFRICRDGNATPCHHNGG
jgi:hypothetical protein